jgi:hypothetical protein
VPQVGQSVPGPNKTGEAHHCLFLINELKAIETYHFRPRYALANLGHPSSSYWDLLGDWLLPSEVYATATFSCRTLTVPPNSI